MALPDNPREMENRCVSSVPLQHASLVKQLPSFAVTEMEVQQSESQTAPLQLVPTTAVDVDNLTDVVVSHMDDFGVQFIRNS